MKQWIKFGGALLAVSLVASCGEEKKETYTGIAGSCAFTETSSGLNMCYTVSYSVEATEDPKDLYQSTLGVSCTGTWTPGDSAACSTDGSVGTCVIPFESGDDASASMNMVYGSPYTAETAGQACLTQGGTFTAS